MSTSCWVRWCTKDGADEKFALVEFTDYGAVPAAMRLNNTMIGETMVQVSHILNLALELRL